MPTDRTTTVTVTGNGLLCPTFEKITYTINVRTPTGGMVSPSPGSHSYDCGAGPISIRATPAQYYQFKEWDSGNGVTVANPTSASTTMTVNSPPFRIPPLIGYLCPVFEKKTATVPNLIGTDASEIGAVLNVAELVLGTRWYGLSDLEPGLVFDQNPEAGPIWAGARRPATGWPPSDSRTKS